MLEADITFKTIDAPINNWCDSGHRAIGLFKRGGPDSKAEPVRFFQVISKNIRGCFCEPCIIIARRLSDEKKKKLQCMK